MIVIASARKMLRRAQGQQIEDRKIDGDATIPVLGEKAGGLGLNEHLARKVEPEKQIAMMWFHRVIRGHIGRKVEQTMCEAPRITIMPRATFIAEIHGFDTEALRRHFKQSKHHRMRHPLDTG